MAKTADYTERVSAIHLLRSGHSVAEVAEQVDKSLAWVYKWRSRFFERQHWDDLNDRSRAPKHPTNRIPDEMRQAIRQTRSELEAEAEQPGKLSYIGAKAIRNRLKQKGYRQVPSRASIERIIAGMTHPRAPSAPEVVYPHLHAIQPHQLTQVDIVPHYLPGGPCVSCFNAIDVVSRYPAGAQSLTKRSTDAVQFLLQVFSELGISVYTQMDNEGCFSGGMVHPGVIGKALRLALYVGTEAVFSPFYHPESNGTVERFHQDYTRNTWAKTEMIDLVSVQSYSANFYELYRHSGHHSALDDHSPDEVHWEQPALRLPEDFCLPKEKLPITEGKAHFIRKVRSDQTVSVLNLDWHVPKAKVNQGTWATLQITRQGAKLRIYDAAPDALKRTCLAEHLFPLKEPVQPLRPEFQRPIPVSASWCSLAANLFCSAVRNRVTHWLSTML